MLMYLVSNYNDLYFREKQFALDDANALKKIHQENSLSEHPPGFGTCFFDHSGITWKEGK